MVKDKILLSGMQFYGRHGVFPEEKSLGQKFIIDVELTLDLRKACVTDDVNHTINYADLYASVEKIVTQKNFNLIEALAESIAQEILQNNRIDQIKVKVCKPHAPINGIFDYMGCEIIRGLNL
ncbi:dihydroneopterin aldolase [Phosphitispora sp. TUW77]|uniref:dihydroneopterin aldolase n=1 Tax=Phosphitispora sp. TUW77 TaxID=3152361 RepID=UPI003AB579D8